MILGVGGWRSEMWVDPVPLSLSETLLYRAVITAHNGLFELLTLRAPKSTAAATGVWRGVGIISRLQRISNQG